MDPSKIETGKYQDSFSCDKSTAVPVALWQGGFFLPLVKLDLFLKHKVYSER